MKEVIKKIQKARQQIKTMPIMKDGSNNGKNYFTPSQISNLVAQAEQENGLFHKFDLLQSEVLGDYGKLIIHDMDNDESMEFIQLTAISDLKGGANDTQKMGSTVTYTKRYMLTNAYDIAENDNDPDALPLKKKGNIDEFESRIQNAKNKEDLKIIWDNLAHDITIKDWEQSAVTLLQNSIKEKLEEFGLAMKITNKLNLPTPIVEAIKNDSYDGNSESISATSLISPARMYLLKKKYGSEIVEDASDRIYSLLGQALHAVLERADQTGIKEKRLYAEVNHQMISGQFDRLALISKDGGMASVLQDYKQLSVWAGIYGLDEEKTQQLNIYAFLLRENGYNVDKLEIVAIYRDWQKSKAKFDKKYPKHQIQVFEIELWSYKKQLAFIKSRLELFKNAELSLPMCSQSERWATDDVLAVKKKDVKKAVKLFIDEELANKFMENHKDSKKLYIEHRKGENKRCDNYCSVKEFCEKINNKG